MDRSPFDVAAVADLREVLNRDQDRALVEQIGQTTKRKFAKAMTSANGLRAKYLAMPIAQGI